MCFGIHMLYTYILWTLWTFYVPVWICAGRSAFARPCVGVHKSTSLMSSSLLLQQCPACLVRLTWIVFVIRGRWPYSWCLVGCCRQDLSRLLAAKAGRPARTYIQQLCKDTGCCPEDLPEAMHEKREKWLERVRDIRATSTTWWWWWWCWICLFHISVSWLCNT